MDTPDTNTASAERWHALAAHLATAGRWLVGTAAAAGRSVGRTARALDPQVGRHLKEGALLGAAYAVPGWGAGLWEGSGSGRPILFVHGLGGSPRNFGPLRSWLRAVEQGPSDAVAFDDHSSIEVMARQLQWKILQLAEGQAPGQPRSIDIVAHSMGGIITRLALTDPSVAERVGHLITLGTPHSGTGLARFLQTPKVLGLRPGSEVLAQLESQLPWPAKPTLPRLTCLWSPDDMLMHPPETACVDGAENLSFPGYTHLGFLVKPAAWMLVAEALRGPARLSRSEGPR